MGAVLRKLCVEDDALGKNGLDAHAQRRMETLMVGAEVQQVFRFSKSDIRLQLSDDGSKFHWRTLRTARSKHASLRVADMSGVDARGERGLRFVGGGELLEVVFADERRRDAWVTAVNELLARREPEVPTEPEQQRPPAPTPDEDRWQRRHDELERRREGRSSLRAKYADAGSAHTDRARRRRASREPPGGPDP